MLNNKIVCLTFSYGPKRLIYANVFVVVVIVAGTFGCGFIYAWPEYRVLFILAGRGQLQATLIGQAKRIVRRTSRESGKQLLDELQLARDCIQMNRLTKNTSPLHTHM